MICPLTEWAVVCCNLCSGCYDTGFATHNYVSFYKDLLALPLPANHTVGKSAVEKLHEENFKPARLGQLCHLARENLSAFIASFP